MTRSRLLYHYTTADGLIGIVSTQQLWATRAFYFNDAGEILGGIRTAQEQLRRLQEASRDPEDGARWEWLSKQLARVGTELTSMPVFVCSLSAAPDLLSQWRAYCRGGGFAIGLPADALSDVAASQGFSLTPCVYSEDDHGILMRETIETVAVSGFGRPISHSPRILRDSQ